MKNIVCYDVETTGLSIKNDYIIQLSLIKFNPETFERLDSRNWYIKPLYAYTIDPGAAEKNGLTKEFIEENGVHLKDICEEIIEFFDDCNVLSYNGNSFDINFLCKDMEACGYEFPLEGRVYYDAMKIYKELYPSTLSAVYKRYTGQELDGAHNSLCDVEGTIEVFKHELQDEKLTYEQLDEKEYNKILSPEGSIQRLDSGDIIFRVGKYKNSEFINVYKKDPLYIKWFGENVASIYTKRILNNYILQKRNEKPQKPQE